MATIIFSSNRNQTTDATFETELSGFYYGADNIYLNISMDVVVRAFAGVAVYSTYSDSALINNGLILSASTYAVAFDGDNSYLFNNSGHGIVGLSGVRVLGEGANITNHGDISGLTTNGINLHGVNDDYVLNNHGDIFGQNIGVSIHGADDGGVIHNFGTIRSEGSAISASAGGRIDLNNRGMIDGDIDANTFNEADMIVNRGKIKGDVFLGSGKDIFKSKGSGSSGDVFGEAGNDTLIGGKKGDTLDGGADSDLLRGGKGKDKLFGGTDSDTFDFNSIKDSVRGSKRDKIIDFQRGPDEIDLKNIDAKTGVSGNQKFKWIGKSDFHDKKGEVRYEDKGSKVIVQGDVNGDSKADFEIFVHVGKLTDDDFVL